MDYLLLTAGILALGATIGHFTMGSKDFLKPILRSEADEIPKKVMHSLFHYMSVFMVLSTVILLGFSMKNSLIFDSTDDVIKVIGFFYLGIAIVQFIIAATSKINNGIFKLFQWVFWILIAAFSLLSVY
ncbi:MAG: hypothetical protein V3R52_00830 [Candidatus Neomarinimicrobiota bacterium]